MNDGIIGKRTCCENCEGTFVIGKANKPWSEGPNFQECPHCLHSNELPVAGLVGAEPEERGPRPLGYLDAKPFASLSWPAVLDNLQTPGLRAPATTFCTNINRLHAMLILPVTVSAYSRLFQQCKDQAIQELGEGNERIDDRIVELGSEWHATNNDAQRRAYIVRYGQGTFGRFASGPIRMGCEAMLIAQVTGMWTAVETLAGDLWEAAINAHPHRLSELKGKGKPQGLSGPDTQPAEKSQKAEKSVKLRLIQKYKFDLSKYMGTMLKGRYNFTSLNDTNGMRAAYWEAFEDDHVRATVDSVELKALACVRNVFVHKAGVIDEKFQEELNGVPQLADLLSAGRIRVTGQFVQNLILPVITTCCDLIHSVDNWLICNP